MTEASENTISAAVTETSEETFGESAAETAASEDAVQSGSNDEEDCIPGITDHDKVAVSKMNDMNKLFKLMNVMDPDPDTEGFVKADDERLKTVEDLRQFIYETCSGKAREEFLNTLETYQSCYAEKDGELYYKPAGRGFLMFVTEGGVTVTDPAMNYFTATTNKDDEMNPFGRAVFHFDGDHWTVESYEFGDFASDSGES